jgi:uncharacterized repeat protein (TIGR01451 family)
MPTRALLLCCTAVALMLPAIPAGASPATQATDPFAGAIVQRGMRNYAGPSCPGQGWTCTTATDGVVQIAPPGGENRFVCSGTDCAVRQSGGTANRAECSENVKTDVRDARQSCVIEQTGAKNSAFVLQVIHQTSHDEVTARQSASITQLSDVAGGSNFAHVIQRVKQQGSGDDGNRLQSQDGIQTLTIDQRGLSSQPNQVVSKQSQSQELTFSGGGPITQSQNGSGATKDVDARIEQVSGTGTNSVDFEQWTAQAGTASNGAAAVTQLQGTREGGLEGTINQLSEGLSSIAASQEERQDVHADALGGATQIQEGPQGCCSSQRTNPNNRFDIDQLSVQTASTGDAAQQRTRLQGRCHTSGRCDVEQTATQNGETVTNRCSGSDCDDTTICVNADCQAGPTAPDSTIVAGVRNASVGQTTFTEATNADAGDDLEYRYTYANTGNGPAGGVTVTTTIPAHTSFEGCSGGCQVQGSTVTWQLGDVPALGAAAVTLAVGIENPLIDVTTGAPILSAEIRNAATADSAQEDPLTSNTTRVTVRGLLSQL